MYSKFFIFIIGIFMISNVFAICEDGQIDVNSATIEELDLLYGVGPAKAQNIVDARPYENVDDLINANGIGEITLENIKNQGLACVFSFEEKVEDVEEDEFEENLDRDEEIKKENEIKNVVFEEKKENTERTLIDLNPKDIKTEEDNQNLNKNNYAIYGFVTFCILLLFLFVLKNKNQFNKNEFR